MAQRVAIRTSLSKLRNQAPSAVSSLRFQFSPRGTRFLSTRTILCRNSQITLRHYHAAPVTRQSILPDGPAEEPKESEPHETVSRATPLTNEEYHKLADEFMETLQARLEDMHEDKGHVDVDVQEGVLNITAQDVGVYVINKQPPAKQIWLSSPMSGPKKFDYVVMGDSMHQKEGASVSDWVYLKDNTSLKDLLKKELGVVAIDDAYEKIPGST